MSIVIALFCAIMIMIFLLLRVKFYIGLNYQRQGANDSLTVTIYCWRKLLFYQMKIPVIAITDQGRLWVETNIVTDQGEIGSNTEAEIKAAWHWIEQTIRKPRLLLFLLRKLRNYIHFSRRLTRQLLTEVCCEKFYWHTQFGTSDAAVTGVMSGLLWSMKALVLSRLTRRIHFVAKPSIRVCPDFQDTGFTMEFKCIFSLRLGNVMNACFFVEKNINKGVAAVG
jgi:hypothetical protein